MVHSELESTTGIIRRTAS